VLQPTKFALVIISSRETLDVKISDNLLSLAHEVIENKCHSLRCMILLWQRVPEGANH
jgi:hypothetical protein